MRSNSKRKPRPPLDAAKLSELALAYVGRFATTRAKLKTYLARKVRERGWGDGPAVDLEALAERFAAQGYIDDAAYALSKSRSLTARGYGLRRVDQSLHIAGVDAADAAPAQDFARSEAVDSALRFAERRLFGPFARGAVDRKLIERALGAMIRAGHNYRLARAILDLAPGAEIDMAELSEVR
ncbi:MAG: RecX family transcriptional regulator [Sphingomicrobium sp.]